MTIQGDTRDESDESFQLVISGPEVVDGEGTATIVDDDPPPAVAVADAPATDEQAGAVALFTVSLSSPSGRDVSVGYATRDGNAVGGEDFVADAGRLTIGYGVTQQTVGGATARRRA